MKVVEIKKRIGLKVSVLYKMELTTNVSLLNSLSEKEMTTFIQASTANGLVVFNRDGEPKEEDLKGLSDKVVVVANTDCNCRKSVTDYINNDKNNYYILIDCYRGLGRKARFEDTGGTLTLKYE